MPLHPLPRALLGCLLLAGNPAMAQSTPGSAFTWSTDPNQNGTIDPAIPAQNSTPARQFMPAVRGVMAGVAQALGSGGRPNGLARLGSDGRLPPDQLSASGNASGLSTQMLSATTALLINRHLSLLPLPVEAFGAVGDGVTNDAPAINRAIQTACARGGGTVVLMRRHGLGDAIDNNCGGVFVDGIGGAEIQHSIGSDTTNAGTFITPTAGYQGDGLRHRTRPASELGIPAAQNRIISGGGFRNITVQSFKRNLHVTSTRRATYILTLNDANGTESALFDTIPDPDNGGNPPAQLGEGASTQAMTLDLVLRQYEDGVIGPGTGNVDGVVFTGPGGNISYNNQMRLQGRVHNGIGFKCISCDNNIFSLFRMYVYGTGKPFLIQANVVGVSANDSNFFDHYWSNVPGRVEGLGDRPNGTPPIQTTINFPDLSNNTALPTAGTGTDLTIVNNRKPWLDWTPTFSAASGSFSGSLVPSARYNRDALSNTIRFSAVFRLDYTTAPSGLRFTLPVPVRDSGTFPAYSGSTGRMIVCTVGANSNLATCVRDGGATPLEGSGNYYSVSGTYETP